MFQQVHLRVFFLCICFFLLFFLFLFSFTFLGVVLSWSHHSISPIPRLRFGTLSILFLDLR
jgi:hypothetical protein